MSRGIARMRTFLDDDDREGFLDSVSSVVEDGALVVHAYCLMPNHYHLLCETPQAELARWMQRINGSHARRFNARHRRVGHLWQGRYKAILVGDGEYFLECSRYIHLNPNRSKLTRPAERYRWSSYRSYVGGPRAARWVSTERTLSHFGGDRRRYRAFVEAGKGEKPVSPFERAVAGLVLGGEDLVDRVRGLVRRIEDGRDQPSLSALRRSVLPDPEQVEALVERVFARELPRRKKRLMLYALRKHTALRPSEIARRHLRSPAAVTLAVRDLDDAARTDSDLARALRRLAKAADGDPHRLAKRNRTMRSASRKTKN